MNPSHISYSLSRILILCSRLPYPITGGAKLRMFYTARELAREYDVELLVIDEDGINQSSVKALEEIFEAVHIFQYPKRRFYMNTLRGFLSQKPFQTFYYHFHEVDEWIDKHSHQFDLLYCNHVRTTEYARGHNLPVVVDLVDAISRNYQEASKDAGGLWRFIYPIEWRKLARYERRVIQDFNHSFIITEEDRQFILESEFSSSLSVLPNGVKPDLLEGKLNAYRSDPEDPRIVFLGKMDYFPNEDAAKYFTADIFPQIRSTYPNAEFMIVGTSPTEDILALRKHDGVTVTGYVNEPRVHMQNADIVVAPMRHGAGLQNKILEAMALGRPVIASPLAKEGIDASDGKHLIIADGTDEFTEAVDLLLTNANQRKQIGVAARRLIEERYTWDHVGDELRGRISSVIQ